MKKAVTLVEILLVVVLSALLMTVIIPFIRSVNDTWNVGSSKTEILQNGRAALETMTRYIRQARRITRIPDSSGNYIKIRDRQDTYNIIFYHNILSSPYYIGESGIIKVNDLVMRSDSSGAYVDSLLASSLPSPQSSIFYFFKDDGASATKANQVKSVKIRMDLSDPLGSTSHTLNLDDTITLRQDVRISSPVWFSNSNYVGELSSDILVDISNVKSVSANYNTRKCWVADTSNNRVIRINSEGTIDLSFSPAIKRPTSVSVDPTDDSCWIANTDMDNVVKLDTNGSRQFTLKGFNLPCSVSVNWSTGECWVADANKDSAKRVAKVSKDGKSIIYAGLSFSNPQSVSVNSSDGSCWVTDTGNNRIVKLYSNGATWTIVGGFNQPQSVSVNPLIDPHNNLAGVCWVADTRNNSIKKLHPTTGAVLVNAPGFNQPQSVSVDSTTGACWVADTGNNRIVRLNSAGDIEFDIKGFNSPLSVSARP